MYSVHVVNFKCSVSTGVRVCVCGGGWKRALLFTPIQSSCGLLFFVSVTLTINKLQNDTIWSFMCLLVRGGCFDEVK